MTATTDQKLDAILQALKGLEARVTLIENGQGKTGYDMDAHRAYTPRGS